MKIILLTVIKDEIDFVEYWLNFLDSHVDHMMFLDNESTDGTKEILKIHPKTIYCETIKGAFYVGMWNKLFQKAQKEFSIDDWIFMSSSDTLPLFNIREKIEIARGGGHNGIRIIGPTFFYTLEMHKKCIENEEYGKQIENFNINNYKHFYNVSNSLPRLLRNLPSVRVGLNQDNPANKIKKRSIYFDDKNPTILGHYRFRNYKQIKKKLERQRGTRTFRHYGNIWNPDKYLISEKHLYEYDGTINSFIGKTKKHKLLNLIEINSGQRQFKVKKKKKGRRK